MYINKHYYLLFLTFISLRLKVKIKGQNAVDTTSIGAILLAAQIKLNLVITRDVR